MKTIAELKKEIKQINDYAKRQKSFGASSARISKLQRNAVRLQEIESEIYKNIRKDLKS